MHVEIKPKVDDGIDNVIKVQVDDDSCIKSFNVGGISGLGTLGGVHDIPSMTLCYLLGTFQVACPSITFYCG